MIEKNNINHGDLFLVDFNPSVGHEYQGQRPALVVETNRQIKKSNLITVLPLTSNLDNRKEGDIFVKADANNRLKFDSIIKVYNIVSFDCSRFINKIGKIDDKIVIKIKQYLRKHFDI